MAPPQGQVCTRYIVVSMRLALLTLALLGAAFTLHAEDCLSLSEMHQDFELVVAANSPAAPEFCKGASAISLQRLRAGKRHFSRFLRGNPDDRAVYRVHEVLTMAYFRVGGYRQSLAELKAMLSIRPSSEDAKAMLPLLTALSRYPDQVTKNNAPSILQRDETKQIPVMINGKPASYFADTGANLSILSEREASRLGMNIQDVSTKVRDSSGLQVGMRVATASDVLLGKTHLKHVAFIVLPD